MNLPAITPAMIATFVGQIVAVAVAFGANLTPDQQKSLLALSAAFGAVALWIDKEIRKNRAQNATAIAEAQKTLAELPAPKKPVNGKKKPGK